MLLPVSNSLCDTLGYHYFCLAHIPPKYVECAAKSGVKWTKRLQVQMKTNIFHTLDPISVITFPSTFKLVCDSNKIYEGATMSLLPFHMKEMAAATPNSGIALLSKLRKQCKEGMLTCDSKAMNCLLEIFARNDAFAKLDDEILLFTHPSKVTPKEYAEALWNRAFRWDL